MLSPLVQIRPADPQVLVARSERVAAGDALQVELTLARAALERGDVDGFHTALNRSSGWITRLWPDSPALHEVLGELESMREAPLHPQSPLLDSTLPQLRALRDGRDMP